MTDIKIPYGPLAFFVDLEPRLADFRADAIDGLSARKKALPPKYFYDAAGSALFEDITRLEAYYPTRTERAIMQTHGAAIRSVIGPNAAVLEYGAGAPDKIRLLLEALDTPAAYVAMDISRDHLLAGMSALARELEGFPVGAVCADFSEPVRLPREALPKPDRWLGYFPGSTIGNLDPAEAERFLRHASETLGPDAFMLIGVDLDKDSAILRNAYDDPEGTTAAFNLNLLRRMVRELDAEIDLDAFAHCIVVNPNPRRVEMHLKALRATQIRLADRVFAFEAGETIHTENSHKYTTRTLEALIEPGPWRLKGTWTDDRGWFAKCLLCNS